MKKSALALIVMFMATLIVTACTEKAPPPPSVVRPQSSPETTFDFEEAITIGNHSYLPLNMAYQNPANNIKLILSTLNAFEKKHPELKITGKQIEKQQDAHGTCDLIFGLWVDHEPRE